MGSSLFLQPRRNRQIVSSRFTTSGLSGSDYKSQTLGKTFDLALTAWWVGLIVEKVLLWNSSPFLGGLRS
jgi:hypothetical protein